MKTVFENALIRVKTTGRDYDFIAVVENKTEHKLDFLPKDDLEEDFERFSIEPNDWIGLLADSDGRDTLDAILYGRFVLKEGAE